MGRQRHTVRVYGRAGTGMARAAWCQDALHRAGQSVGEQIHRIVQRQTQRRASERRDLRYDIGGGACYLGIEGIIRMLKKEQERNGRKVLQLVLKFEEVRKFHQAR
jgi:hypothetical protein